MADSLALDRRARLADGMAYLGGLLRLLNIFSALSGFIALIAIIYAAYAVNTAAPLILGGGATFSGTLYAVSTLGAPATLAPVGGIASPLSWVALAFAEPGNPADPT